MNIDKENLIKMVMLWNQIDDSINHLDLFELNLIFNEMTKQTIPSKLVIDFYQTGMTNIEYLTSSYLPNRGYKNLLQCIKNA